MAVFAGLPEDICVVIDYKQKASCKGAGTIVIHSVECIWWIVGKWGALVVVWIRCLPTAGLFSVSVVSWKRFWLVPSAITEGLTYVAAVGYCSSWVNKILFSLILFSRDGRIGFAWAVFVFVNPVLRIKSASKRRDSSHFMQKSRYTAENCSDADIAIANSCSLMLFSNSYVDIRGFHGLWSTTRWPAVREPRRDKCVTSANHTHFLIPFWHRTMTVRVIKLRNQVHKLLICCRTLRCVTDCHKCCPFHLMTELSRCNSRVITCISLMIFCVMDGCDVGKEVCPLLWA